MKRSIFSAPTILLNSRLLSGLLLAAVFFVAAITGSPAMAGNHPGQGHGPPSHFCILMAMLGAVPPQCQDDHEVDDGISDEVQAQLDALQLSVMPFFNYDVAVSAGWDTILGGCVESPLGGMGYHLHNMDQLLNGYLTLLRPEVLLYAPMEDGSMEFVGVEYIIPGELWDAEEPPHFMGQHLHFNPNVGPAGIWALHVWVGKHNENGIFDDWNPDVSCEFAPEE